MRFKQCCCSSTPTLFNLQKIDPDTSTVIWQANFQAVGSGNACQRIEPLHGTNDVIVQQDGYLMRIDSTGAVIWVIGSQYNLYTLPGSGIPGSYGGVRQFAVDGNGAIARINSTPEVDGIDPATGSVIWTDTHTTFGISSSYQPTSIVGYSGGGFHVSCEVIGSGQTVAIAANDYNFGIDAATGSVLWNMPAFTFSTPPIPIAATTNNTIYTVKAVGPPPTAVTTVQIGLSVGTFTGTMSNFSETSEPWNTASSTGAPHPLVCLARVVPNGRVIVAIHEGPTSPGGTTGGGQGRISVVDATWPLGTGGAIWPWDTGGLTTRSGIQTVDGATLPNAGNPTVTWALGVSPVQDLCGTTISGTDKYFGVGQQITGSGGAFNIFRLDSTAGATDWTLLWGTAATGQIARCCTVSDDGYLYVGGDVTS